MKGKMSKDKKVRRVFEYENCTRYSDLPSDTRILEYSLTSLLETYDFSTLYTTFSHLKLKDRLREFVQLCFIK